MKKGRSYVAAPSKPAVDLWEQELQHAIMLHQKGKLTEAKSIYLKVLKQRPNNFDALHLLGVIASQTNDLKLAAEFMRNAIHIRNNNPVVYYHQGLVLHRLKRLDEALASYDRAIAIKPDYAVAYLNCGNVLQELKRLDEALASYDRAIAIKPDYAEAYSNRGVALQELRRLDAALVSHDRAIAIKPDYAEAYSNRGLALKELKRLDEALASYDRAIAIKPDYAEAYSNRGVALKELKRLDEALASHDRAIAIKPEYAEAYSNRGVALQELKRLDEALASHDRAIAIKPDYAEAYSNRGNVLRELKRLDEALASYDRAIAIKPDYAEAYSNRGLALQELKRLDEALASHDRAIAIKPDYADAYWHKSIGLLLGGQFDRGWALFEWRWKVDRLILHRRNFSQPLWLGAEPLEGKTILLHVEQGLGDTIQFCRYAKLASELGAKVLLEAPKLLLGLFKSLEGVGVLIEQGQERPAFDYHCPLLSLPLAFKTQLSTIPSPTPYLFADETKTRYWQKRIGDRRKSRVGVVWNGGFRPNRPDLWGVNERRNIRLDVFAQALNEIDVDFFSLQKGDPAESEIRNRESQYWHRGNFHNFTDEIKDFSDTAALVANLDLVVAVDTSTAHLSAALGKPTWILNRFDTCWRWLLDRDDSPWYESVKLYRQAEDRNWQPVLQRVAGDLSKLADEHLVSKS